MARSVTNSLDRETRSYSYSESGSPRRLDDASAFIGNLQINLKPRPNMLDIILYNREIELTVDGSRTSGIATSISSSETDTSLTLDHVTSLFNAEATVLPYSGTFQGAMEYYLDLMGITVELLIDTSVASREVVNPGWYGNVWSKLKQFFAVQGVEMSYQIPSVSAFSEAFSEAFTATAPRLVIREPRQRNLTWSGRSVAPITVGSVKPANYVDITTHGNEYVVQGEVYAPDDGSVISVDAGETYVQEVTLDATVISLNQPVCVDWVNDRDYSNSEGVYSVAGSDGVGIKADQWLDAGGSLLVEMTEDPSVMRITVVGAGIPELAPFRISMTSGEYYNSLHVTATAVRTTKETVRIYTGADPALVPPGDGPTIENIFVANSDDAYRVGQWDAAYYSGAYATTSFEAGGLDQAWGDITGSLFQLGNLLFRVTTYSESNYSGTLTGEVDITMDDFNASHGATTMADFNSLWSTPLTMNEFSLQILRGGDGA